LPLKPQITGAALLGSPPRLDYPPDPLSASSCAADRFVGTTPASENDLGGKFTGANVRRGLLDNLFGLVELFRVAGGHLHLVVLQVMERQAHGVPLEYLFRARA